MFEDKAGAYPSEAPLKGRLLALPKNIRLGWKGWPGINDKNSSLLRTVLNYNCRKF
jgi:hypothetical protein